MYRMLTCFNLADGVTIAEFDALLRRFSNELVGAGLLVSTGPIGNRHRHPVMDTDADRDHEYFFEMCFHDLAQCDEAVNRFQDRDGHPDADHVTLHTMVKAPVLLCREALDSDV